MERYARYKNSGIDWIGEIPEGWEINRNKHLNSLFGRIGWQGLSSDEYTDEGPKLITGVNFSKGRIDWDGCVSISEERWGEAEQIQIKEDDLLITKDGTVGKVAMATNCPEKASLNSGVLLIRPTTNKACKRYLFWMLQSNVFWGWFSNTNAGNSTIIHLYQSSFADMPLLLPSIEEQATIAAFLDTKTKEIDLAVEAAEKSIILLHEYRQSIITEAVTHGLAPDAPMKPSGIEWIGNVPESWEITRLGRLAAMLTPMRDRPEDLGGPIPWIRIEDFDGKYISRSKDGLGVSQDTVDSMNLKVYPVGTVLCTSSCDLGKCAIVATPLVSNQRFIGVIPNEKVSSSYLYYLISTQAERLNYLSTGSIQANLSRKSFERLSLAVPDLSEQHSISDYLDAKTAEIDALIASKTRQVELLREYRKSIISEAVTGKFKVPGLE